MYAYRILPSAYCGEYFIVVSDDFHWKEQLEQIKLQIRSARFQPEDRPIGRFSATEVAGFLTQATKYVGACTRVMSCN